MSETRDLTYAALITITVPGDGRSITVPVVLSPADSVPIDGQSKMLADCTLADLHAYAVELEKEVWDAYEAISLPELDEDEAITVEVVLSSDNSEPVGEWGRQVLLIPDRNDVQEDDIGSEGEADADDLEEQEGPIFVTDELTLSEAIPAEDVADDAVGDATGTAVEAAVADEVETDEPEEPIEADVAVAETELVYPEIEDEVAPKIETRTRTQLPVPEIIPSKARVRVAGAQLPLGHPTWAAVDILMDEPALRATQAHALSSLQREVAGVLVGPRPEKQPDGRYLVHIVDTIVAKYTVMQGASVTYTPESWRYLNDTLAERYPDDTAVMVGWYHTHPGFGIFLSGMDLFIHQNFFTQIWHVAMVLDPRARTSGFFCWDRPKAQVSRCDFGWPPWAAGSW